MSRETGFRLGAMGCFLLYIISFLFLPYVAEMGGYGHSGVDCFFVSGWAYLILATGIAAAICTMTVPAKPAAVICLAAALIALIAFFPIRMEVAARMNRVTTNGIYVVPTAGFGLVLCILCGIGAAVLCFLSEYASKPVKHTPGLTADPDDEW
ncbi:MAG: hypothetical protein IKE15_09110 [Clostridia bacterium]|nr:hypothetical protein [Clostridia bacterium]